MFGSLLAELRSSSWPRALLAVASGAIRVSETKPRLSRVSRVVKVILPPMMAVLAKRVECSCSMRVCYSFATLTT